MRDLLFFSAMTLAGVGMAACGIVVGWWLRGVHDPPAAHVYRLPARPRSIPEPRRVRRHTPLYDIDNDIA